MSTPVTLHLRLGRPGAEAWTAVTLPAPREAGLGAETWEGVSVSGALQAIQVFDDAALAALLSCRRGLCNICAMRIDGEVTTACTTPVRNGQRIEPARDSLFLRDTVVELSLVRRARAAPSRDWPADEPR